MTLKEKLLCLLLSIGICTDSAYSQHKHPIKWGDQRNGTYINPILNADYSDPDVIRVKNKYYMVCSDFHFIGMQVLESDDMINWKIISQIYSEFPGQEWNKNQMYGSGAWAPSLRFHDNKFWMFVCTPHELYMSQASDPHGPWSPLHVVKKVEHWEDPCPIWTQNGEAYLGRSQWGGGPIIIHRMSPDGKSLLDEGVTVYTGPVSEGIKFYFLNDYYYISIPEGGVATGWQTILRSKNIYGPYEKKVVLEQGCTDINGPHQGSLVNTPEGEWWFYHFQSTEPLGRVVHLQPVHWKDNWPLIGVDIDMNGIGEPVKVWSTPYIKKNSTPILPQTNDSFNNNKLGLQWQFNHNPDNVAWSLTERKGCLCIHASKAENLQQARNMLTQKCMGYQSEAVTKVELKHMKEGQRVGLLAIGNTFYGAGVIYHNGRKYVYIEKNGIIKKICEWKHHYIYLKIIFNARQNSHQFYYSTNETDYKSCGKAFNLHSGNWKGIRTGLFTYNTNENAGTAYFDYFKYAINE